MKQSLLSHIAGNFIREYENVANTTSWVLLGIVLFTVVIVG